MLKLININAGYGKVQILRDCSLDVARGECVSLIGPNGVGKTTLLKTVVNLTNRYSGEIIFGDKKITDLACHQIALSGISYIPEGGGIYSELTTFENLNLGTSIPRKTKQLKNSHRQELVFDLFPILKQRGKQLAGNLSGGEQRMLSLGRSLLGEAKLILIDELSAGLAPLVTGYMLDKLADLRKKENLGILLTEQNAEVALNWAERTYVMRFGSIVLEGKSRDLYQSEMVEELYLGKA